MRAHDSMQMAHKLNHVLRNKKITLSSKDIILVDHSVNDALTTGNDSSLVKTGFEWLIREFMHLSHGHHPTIIALEMWPNKSINNYEEGYAEIARHYGVYLWSYSKLVNSEYMEREQQHAEYIDYLRFHKNFINQRNLTDIHPPWYSSALFTVDALMLMRCVLL
jgi:hypothetical protein